jgi:hypothetical protein
MAVMLCCWPPNQDQGRLPQTVCLGLIASKQDSTANHRLHFSRHSIRSRQHRKHLFDTITGVFAELFHINGCLCWLQNSGFQEICHNIIGMELNLEHLYDDTIPTAGFGGGSGVKEPVAGLFVPILLYHIGSPCYSDADNGD